MDSRWRTAAAMALTLAISACANHSQPPATQRALRDDQNVITTEAVPALNTAIATITPSKAATTQPQNNNVTGTVRFTQVGSTLIVAADLAGLQPGTSHAIEIHDTADISDPELRSVGAKWNPTKDSQHPLGELGNIEADSTGRGNFGRSLIGVTVGGPSDVLGHTVIIRAMPIGSAGYNARIAGGVIERADQ